MPFTEFKTLSDVQREYGVKYAEEDFLQFGQASPSQQFLDELEFNRRHFDVSSSEAARCENLIYPVLREVYKGHSDRFSLWSHTTISWDNRLYGAPDYLFATKSELGKTVVGRPLVIVVEAKRNDFEVGWAQCLAELVAAQRLNGDAQLPVFGVVTDGEVWQFGRLIGDRFTKNRSRSTVDDIAEILAAFAWMLNAAPDAASLQTSNA
ncbi:MAG: hypothetical protein KY475_06090 [Planctomycetes bacterium]|nr:hypothetical protein [Planctomycetota bacterium]